MFKNTITILLYICCCCGSYAQHPNAVYLTRARFITGDSSAWRVPAYDDTRWNTITAGKVWQEQGYRDYHGYAWYRIHVTIPSRLKQQGFWRDSLRIFLAHVNDVDETYLNGVLIGKTGAFPDEAGGYISKWPAVRAYHVAAANPAIHWDQENVIAVKVYDGGGSGGIFMGDPYIDMLEKTDGLHITAAMDSIHYLQDKAIVPLTVYNEFNTPFSGVLHITIHDAVVKKDIDQTTIPLALQPFEKRAYTFTVRNTSGITFATTCTENHTSLTLAQTQTIPYILTPPATASPQINSAAITAVRPGSPFLFRIAASGHKPMQYHATGLPAGLICDAATGIITGSIQDSGTYQVQVTVSNQVGIARQAMTIHAGKALALTPPMGWNSWNCWGISVSADKVKRSAQALIDKGLIDYGWSYINIDDGWEADARGADHAIQVNSKFGDMKALGDWLHIRGLKFGIYSSPGPKTCGGYLGSYQYEKEDAATYAQWGVDYLKYDWCSYSNIVRGDTSLDAYIHPYMLMGNELRKQSRDILYSLCQYGMKEVWKWGAQVDAQCWRTTGDIEDTWESLYRIGFAQHSLYPYAGPGHWNDPDMMIVGQVGWGESLHASRLTPDEQYTHVSLWSLLAAPLLIGCDLDKLDAFTLNLLTNREVLAINQDVLGKQAQRLISRDSTQVWVKPLANGSKAIGFFNMGTTYRTITIPWQELAVAVQPQVRDVWRQKDLGRVKNGYTALIAPHGVQLIQVQAP